MSDYQRIASAINFLQENVRQQPSLQALAEHLHLSPYHCQRLFSRWAGTSPKRFLQVLTLELGKQLLDDSSSVLDASIEAGLSSPSRLYDHFVQLEAMTPGDYQRKGADLSIEYGHCETPFGQMFIATTDRGICKASFTDPADTEQPEQMLQQQWPAATLQHNQDLAETLCKQIFSSPESLTTPIRVFAKGTNFQLAVWRALLRIPSGTATTYGTIATLAGNPSAARATGTAIGANPVALLIPCHRVIQQSGALGGYRWGTDRKLAIQAWEVLSRDVAPTT